MREDQDVNMRDKLMKRQQKYLTSSNFNGLCNHRRHSGDSHNVKSLARLSQFQPTNPKWAIRSFTPAIYLSSHELVSYKVLR
jgi:hypothetical protein